MQISLREISDKARSQTDYRFLNLNTMLNERNLLDSWRYLNKNSAPGVDKVSAREYSENLEENIFHLVERLKRKSYRARLIRRKNIPKGKGKKRPLGIPVTEDKLLQTAVKRILEAIYETEFCDFSYGYRPNNDAKRAVKDLTGELQFGRYNYVVEADIKGFFDNIVHDQLIEMLEERINDRPFIQLIRKWLKAGILEETKEITHPVSGTPQGGIVSPVLANVYLHHVIDNWFEEKVKPNIRGRAKLIRYADDFVVLFQYGSDADRFYRTLPKRLDRYGLSISEEKTRILPFSKFRKDSKRFDFLGFEFYWDKSLKGNRIVKRRTSREKLRKSISTFTIWIKDNRSEKLRTTMSRLNRKLRGYYNYYGIIGNYRSLREYYNRIIVIMFKWLNRRSQKRSYKWDNFKMMLRHYMIMKPRITEKVSNQIELFKVYC